MDYQSRERRYKNTNGMIRPAPKVSVTFQANLVTAGGLDRLVKLDPFAKCNLVSLHPSTVLF